MRKTLTILALLGVLPVAAQTAPFAATDSMSTGRTNHGSCLLPDGRVLVFGGASPTGPSNTAQIYTPSAAAGQRWSGHLTMPGARQDIRGPKILQPVTQNASTRLGHPARAGPDRRQARRATQH
jgi:hypothetical protein